MSIVIQSISKKFFLYTLYVAVSYVLFPLFLLYDKLSLRGEKKSGLIKKYISLDSCIWIHASSVGEVQLMEPFIEIFLDKYANNHVVCTTMTDTAYRHIEMEFENNSRFHPYMYRYDVKHIAKRIVNRIHPKILIVAETEIWCNMIYECNENKIPIFLINARISGKSFYWYKKIQSLIQYILNMYSYVLCRDTSSYDIFIKLGIDHRKLIYSGDIKVASMIYDNSKLDNEILINKGDDCDLSNKYVIVAGSTHKGEEELMLNTFIEIKREIENLIMFIVPRHIDRSKEIANICISRNIEYIQINDFKSEYIKERNTFRPIVYIVNEIGILKHLYRIGDIAFVGGTMVQIGGHNVLEPILYNIPVVCGIYIENILETANDMIDHEILRVVSDANELKKVILEILKNNDLRAKIRDHILEYKKRYSVDNIYNIVRLIEKVLVDNI